MRLATFETREIFSVSRIVFLALENLKGLRLLDRMSSLRSFNDDRYMKPPVGGLRAKASPVD